MPEPKWRRILPIALMLAVACTTVSTGTAQEDETDEERQARVGALNLQQLMGEEIIVTATKREKELQEVPVSITVMNIDTVESMTVGAPDIRVLSSRVPSLLIESSFGRSFPRFYIRGLGNTDFDLNASQPVSLLFDEVVLENPVLKGMPMWDIQQIEVLRGPQGTLFGRNTPAGIVKFESIKPSDEFEATIRASIGTFETVDFQGAVGGALSENVSARFSWLYQGRSDWVDNGFTGESDALGGHDTTAFRLQFLFEPTDDFEALFNVHGWDVDGTARLFRANILTPGDDELVGGFDQEVVYHDGRNEQEINSQGAMMRLRWDLSSTTLTSITGYESLDMYSRGDIDGGFGAVFAPPSGPGFIPFPSESADGIPDLTQLTQEFRLANTDDEQLDWLVGAFYFDESLRAETFNFDTLAGGAPAGYSYQDQDAKAWALFGSVDYEATDRLDLLAGLRYSNDEKDFAAERPIPFFQTPTAGPIVRYVESDHVSWDASLVYSVNPELNVFGRVATSFRAPSIQGRILFCPDFEGGTNPATNCVSIADKEEILSIEAGIKSILLDRRLRLNLTAYHFDLDGQQIVAVGGEFNTATLLNADQTTGYGFEADIEYSPVNNWLLRFGASYNPTEINDPNLAVTPCGGGCTVLDPLTADGLALVDGNSLPHAPELILNALIDYRRVTSTGGVIFLSADFAYHSDKQFFLYESEEFESDSFEVGLRGGYGFSDGTYELSIYGRNVTDEEIVRGGIDFNNLTGMTNDPAVFGVEFVARF